MLNLKQSNNSPKKQLWGLLAYKPRWGLTLQGWLVIFGAILLIFLGLSRNIHPFLAYSGSVKGEVLIIEGWIGDEALKSAIAEFTQQNYQLLITTGTPLYRGQYLSEYQNYAQLSAATLTKLGFDPQKIAVVPTPQVQRDRTLTSAIAVKQWLTKQNLDITGINIYSSGVHSRRSWLLYKKVFEPTIQVGVISHPPTSYDANAWWQSSEGVKTIISEAIAYIYVKLLNP